MLLSGTCTCVSDVVCWSTLSLSCSKAEKVSPTLLTCVVRIFVGWWSDEWSLGSEEYHWTAQCNKQSRNSRNTICGTALNKQGFVIMHVHARISSLYTCARAHTHTRTHRYIHFVVPISSTHRYQEHQTVNHISSSQPLTTKHWAILHNKICHSTSVIPLTLTFSSSRNCLRVGLVPPDGLYHSKEILAIKLVCAMNMYSPIYMVWFGRIQSINRNMCITNGTVVRHIWCVVWNRTNFYSIWCN